MDKAPMMRVSKLDAARRQLDCAIELWSADGDEVSVHTLAAAAHQIIDDINQKKGGGELLFDSAIIKEEYHPQWRALLKKSMNFFKHANHDAEEITEFTPISSMMFILFSIIGLQKIGERANDTEHAFLDWLAFHHPEWITETYRKVIEDRIPVDGRREIRALNKNEFFKLMIRARTEARYKGRL